MSNTNAPTSSPAPAGKTFAQIVAVVLAISVVCYLVWDTQATADKQLQLQQQQQQSGAVAPAGAPQASPLNNIPVTLNQVLLPSSKRGVINDSGTFFTDGPAATPSASESGMLFSSKFLVMPSSQSKPPLGPADDVLVTPKSNPKQMPKPAPATVPTQTVGGNKD
ncbi:MAG: hypothetical protein ACI8UD_003575 [Planctomycetota bacterium]|jgi:hypothetical protein